MTSINKLGTKMTTVAKKFYVSAFIFYDFTNVELFVSS